MQRFAPALLSLALLVPLAAHAQHHGHGGHGTPAAEQADSLAEGTVRRVDAAAGAVSIAHGPIPQLGMGPMTMRFQAAPGVDVSTLKAGDKIRFEAGAQGEQLILQGFELAN
ncbi:copper-binding protein [Pseudothauera nasutitermitis]|uniref:Copper-binding protein n=1 Tax=Pseudothauera nasutitermitis TaxID=2565930 RepID=A0A4V3WAY4_9RHOO|nr:copper-binding protein [Pseudothauera nasutitermitis]THF61140.1 copper-binding protein [Pseudothauera nasutitermitis]